MIVFNKKRIEDISEGHWVNQPSENWQVNNVVASYDQARENYCHQRQLLFIAIDNDTWNTHIKIQKIGVIRIIPFYMFCHIFQVLS